MNFFFGGSELIFIFSVLLVFAMFVVTLVRGISQWNRNNHAPRLSVEATVTGKRTAVHHHHHQNYTSRSTRYYVTFQVERGDRMELPMNGSDYGQLMEGDRGRLTFQGTRYVGFERL